MRILCGADLIARTIEILQAAGQRREERVVLWLAAAPTTREPAEIVEVYEPEQITDIDYFMLPTESLRALMGHLRSKRERIVAQVHSHPGAAYHSEADDKWAIIRQIGALSLVLPMFALDTTPENFLEMVMTYELSPENEWINISNEGPMARIGIL